MVRGGGDVVLLPARCTYLAGNVLVLKDPPVYQLELAVRVRVRAVDKVEGAALHRDLLREGPDLNGS